MDDLKQPLDNTVLNPRSSANRVHHPPSKYNISPRLLIFSLRADLRMSCYVTRNDGIAGFACRNPSWFTRCRRVGASITGKPYPPGILFRSSPSHVRPSGPCPRPLITIFSTAAGRCQDRAKRGINNYRRWRGSQSSAIKSKKIQKRKNTSPKKTRTEEPLS